MAVPGTRTLHQRSDREAMQHTPPRSASQIPGYYTEGWGVLCRLIECTGLPVSFVADSSDDKMRAVLPIFYRRAPCILKEKDAFVVTAYVDIRSDTWGAHCKGQLNDPAECANCGGLAATDLQEFIRHIDDYGKYILDLMETHIYLSTYFEAHQPVDRTCDIDDLMFRANDVGLDIASANASTNCDPMFKVLRAVSENLTAIGEIILDEQAGVIRHGLNITNVTLWSSDAPKDAA